MNILFVSTADLAGGAEKNAYDLYKSFNKAQTRSVLIVGTKRLVDSNIFEIDNNQDRNWWARYWRRRQQLSYLQGNIFFGRITGWMANIGELRRWYEWQKGHEDFYFPGSKKLDLAIDIKPDIVHLHNLHGNYFDLHILADLTLKYPVVVTLHDEWLLTGHCSCTLGCEKWMDKCGECPRLDIYPAIKRDGTRYNLQRKKEIYSKSNLFVAAPSNWLLQKARRSILNTGIVDSRLIPYGIDQQVFRPGSKQKARDVLGLPADELVLLYLANKGKLNPFKDFETLDAAIRKIAVTTRRAITFLVVGTELPPERVGHVTIRHIGYQDNPNKVAMIYHSADLFLHAAKSDNFPMTILEALSCGVPVIATAVGGIPEQINQGIDGFLVPQGDSDEIARRALELIDDDDLRQQMSKAASSGAQGKYSLKRQAADYLRWYEQIIESHKSIS